MYHEDDVVNLLAQSGANHALLLLNPVSLN
jgi:hypothetical protein